MAPVGEAMDGSGSGSAYGIEDAGERMFLGLLTSGHVCRIQGEAEAGPKGRFVR